MTAVSVQKADSAAALVRECLDAGARTVLTQLGDYETDPVESVHDARKGIKLMRAVLWLARRGAPDVYRMENRVLRGVGRALGGLRDRTVARQALDGLAGDIAGADADALKRIQGAWPESGGTGGWQDDPDPQVTVAGAIEEIEGFQERLAEMPLEMLQREDLHRGARRSIRACRRTLDDARRTRSAVDFHNWRKAVRRGEYATRILAGLRPAWSVRWEPRLSLLGDLLGAGHDLSVLRDALSQLPASAAKTADIERVAKAASAREAALYEQAVREAEPFLAPPAG